MKYIFNWIVIKNCNWRLLLLPTCNKQENWLLASLLDDDSYIKKQSSHDQYKSWFRPLAKVSVSLLNPSSNNPSMKSTAVFLVALAFLATISAAPPSVGQNDDLPMLTSCHHMDYIKCAGTIAVCAAKCELSPVMQTPPYHIKFHCTLFINSLFSSWIIWGAWQIVSWTRATSTALTAFLIITNNMNCFTHNPYWIKCTNKMDHTGWMMHSSPMLLQFNFHK